MQRDTLDQSSSCCTSIRPPLQNLTTRCPLLPSLTTHPTHPPVLSAAPGTQEARCPGQGQTFRDPTGTQRKHSDSNSEVLPIRKGRAAIIPEA